MRIIVIIIAIMMFSCGDKPSRVYVTGHRHIPYEGGDGATFQNEQWLIFVKRVNGTEFDYITGSKERIIETTKECYYKLKVGDTLKNEY